VAEQLGTGFVNRLMLVQIQSSALEKLRAKNGESRAKTGAVLLWLSALRSRLSAFRSDVSAHQPANFVFMLQAHESGVT
jgi:hypothetical protein